MTADVVQAKYDNLDSVAARFGQSSENTTQLESKVKQCFNALEQGGWQGRGVTAFIAEMNGELFPAMQRMSHVLGEARSVTLEVKEIILKAEEEAAALFGKGGSSGDGGSGSGSGSDSTLDSLIKGVKGSSKYLTTGFKILAALSLTYTMKDGDVIISGGKFGKFLKGQAGLSGSLRQINPADIPAHMAKQGLKLSKFGVALAVIPSWIGDIKQYSHDGATKVMSAMAVDAAIKIPTGMLAKAGGSYLGGAAVIGGAALLGVTAAPAAIVVGGIVGAVVVGVAADKAIGWIDSKTHFRDKTINALDSGINAIGDGASSVGHSVAHHVDGAFHSAVGALQSVHVW